MTSGGFVAFCISLCYSRLRLLVEGQALVITSKFQRLIESALMESQDTSRDADYDRCRTLVSHLLIQLIKDAHDLYRGDAKSFHRGVANEPALCAREGKRLEEWIKGHERFPFYCSVLGLPFEEIRKFVLEVGAGQHEIEVHRLMKSLQSNKNKLINRKVKVATS